MRYAVCRLVCIDNGVVYLKSRQKTLAFVASLCDCASDINERNCTVLGYPFNGTHTAEDKLTLRVSCLDWSWRATQVNVSESHPGPALLWKLTQICSPPGPGSQKSPFSPDHPSQSAFQWQQLIKMAFERHDVMSETLLLRIHSPHEPWFPNNFLASWSLGYS